MFLKKSTLLSVLTLLLTFCAFGQSSYYADELYRQFKFTGAINYYLQAVERNPNVKSVEKLADCYRFNNEYANAASWYEKAAAFENCRDVDFYYWAMMLKADQKYNDAKEKFRIWGNRDESKKLIAQKMIASCDSAQLWIKKPEKANIQKESFLNSDYIDFGAVPFKKGIVFTSNRPVATLNNDNFLSRSYGRPFFKVFYTDTSVSTEKGFSTLPLSKNINSKYNDGPVSFTRNYDTVWFTRTNFNSGAFFQRDVGKLQIYYSLSNNAGWFLSQPFKFNNEKYNYAHPSISKNGRELYFSSDMPGGFGGMDIYMTVLADTGWTKPINLGPEINSQEDDVFPYWNEDTQILYFSSSGHSSMGGLDIFYSKKSRRGYSQAINMHYPINSSKDDFSFVLNDDGKTGYLSSNRDTKSSYDDIYRFELGKPFKKEKAEEEKPTLPDLLVTIQPVTEGKRGLVDMETYTLEIKNIKTGESSVFKKTGREKESVYKIGQEDIYVVEVSNGGYFTFTKTFKGKEIKEMQGVEQAKEEYLWKPEMKKIKYGECVVLQNILYDFNSATLRESSYAELQKLATLMMENPDIKVQIGSHTDSRGSDAYNMSLSQRRAQASVDYIVSLGIDRERILARGYGESEPINKCIDGEPCTEEEYQLNRRTDFRIIGNVPNKQIIDAKTFMNRGQYPFK
jgi:outer membrane protein OmpA-like peptidoglycan-associated protein/tetratricopeptide (TPR) repeat protein